jgi:signal transduction histidine kinase/CheY-like chemotaxis protein
MAGIVGEGAVHGTAAGTTGDRTPRAGEQLSSPESAAPRADRVIVVEQVACMDQSPQQGEIRRRRHLSWGVAVAAALLVFQLGARLGGSLPLWRLVWSDAWWTVSSLAASLCCFATARRVGERHLRTAWLCFGLGALSWFFGMIIWDFDQLIRGVKTPFPSVADILFDGVVPFFVIGAFFYKGRQPSTALTLKQIGDVGIIGSVLLVAAVEILYVPVLDAQADTAYVVTALAYPVLHLSGLLFGLICLWQHVGGARRFVLGLHVTALAVLAFVTTLYAEQQLARRYETGAWLDVLWVAPFLLIAWAAREEVCITEGEERAPRDETARLDILVAPLAVLLWVVVEVVFYDRVSPALVPVQAVAGAGLVAFLTLRAWATHRLERQLSSRVAREAQRARELHVRLVRAQKMEAVGTLAGGVAHDFNNLLHAAIATIALLRRKMTRGVDVAKDLDEVERALWRATDLTARLLSVARKREPRPALVDPRDAVAHVASLLGKVLPRGVELEVVATPVPLIEVDPAGLEHALLNLGLNARDAVGTAGGGKVVIELGTADGVDGVPGTAVTIGVRDNGAGIPPDVLPRVFEPFFTTKASGEGTGLGLAMVEAFAGENRGAVAVDSELGRGSTFRLSFPARSAREPTQESLPSMTGTVMVVDVGDSSGLATTGLLERCGFETIVVSTPEAAVEVAGNRHGSIEVVVADASSGMVGREAVKALRAAGVAAPIILIAGAGSDPSGDWAAVVRKPVDPRELAAAVRQVMMATPAPAAPVQSAPLA